MPAKLQPPVVSNVLTGVLAPPVGVPSGSSRPGDPTRSPGSRVPLRGNRGPPFYTGPVLIEQQGMRLPSELPRIVNPVAINVRVELNEAGRVVHAEATAVKGTHNLLLRAAADAAWKMLLCRAMHGQAAGGEQLDARVSASPRSQVTASGQNELETSNDPLRCLRRCRQPCAPPKSAPGVGRTPVCGRCKEPLQRRPSLIIVTDATFAEQVERSPLPVLLDMWAPWCGPCRAVSPIVEEIAGEPCGRASPRRKNECRRQPGNRRPLREFRAFPRCCCFQNGREVDRIIGAQPKTEILRRVRLAFPRN